MHHDLSSLLRVDGPRHPPIVAQPAPSRSAPPTSPSNTTNDQVVRAERALAALCAEFRQWMTEECGRLSAAHVAVCTQGYHDDTAMELLYAAHDIRAHAAAYGYAAAGEIADGLCRLIEFGDAQDEAIKALVERHVEAIAAVVRAIDAQAGGSMAHELVERLKFFTDQQIQVNESGEMLASPPLAPA